MSSFFSWLLFLGLLAQATAAQVRPRPDSARVVVLADVAVRDKITRLVVASGKAKRSTFQMMPPGGSWAVRFNTPRAGYHMLSSIRVHLFTMQSYKEGRLRVRAASVAASGEPADDDLLPAPVLLSTSDLRRAHKHLVLTWPTARVTVPDKGFFLVLEALGNFPDEYVSQVIPPTEPRQEVVYELRRRNQPDASPRRADMYDFPALMCAEPTATETESWYRDTVTQQWHLSRERHSVVFLEAVFE